jgi:ribonucleoside-diphosphate reductase subunit M1
LRTRPAVDAIQFTVDQEMLKNGKNVEAQEENLAAMTCSIDNKDSCLMCSG